MRATLVGLLVAVAAGSLAGVVAPALAPAPARADTVPVSYGAPSWWRGDCDTDNWTAKARAAGWTGEAAHRLGGQVLGIPVCGPRNLAGGPNIWWSRAGWGELEWQCVEFAQRFMIQVYGTQPYQANGVEVVRNYTAARGGGLVRVDNGTVGKAPAPGDVVSFSSPSNVYGHVAVVATSNVDANGNGTVKLATQNDTVDGWRTLSVSNWKMAAFGSLYPYAWLHDPLGRGGSGLSDGAFVVHAGSVFRLAGGAPVYVSSFTPFGGYQPYVTLSDAQWASLRTVPRDGTYLRDPVSGKIYRVAGGSALYVTSCAPAALAGCGTHVEVDPAAIANAGAGGPWDHLAATIADSTMIRVADGAKAGLVARAAGGSLLWLTDCGPLGGCPGIVDVNEPTFDAYGTAHGTPADGTVVEGAPSGQTRYYGGGVCRVTQPGADLSGAVTVNDQSLVCISPLVVAGAPTTTLVATRATRATLRASGGSGAYGWTATSALPAGLTLAADGTLVGTPTAAGSYSFGVRLVDARYPTDGVDGSVTVTVVAPLVATPSTTSLSVGPVAVAFGAGGPVSGGVSGGIGSYTFAVTAGKLPPGLSLSAGGQLTGSATAVGTWVVTLTVTDGSTPAQTTTLPFTVTVAPTGGLGWSTAAPSPGG